MKGKNTFDLADSVKRPVRPGFAEDVYGSGRPIHASAQNQPGLANPNMNDSSVPQMCGSALAQRRSANLPKLKELCAGSSSDLNISSTECPLASARANQMSELDFQYADSDNFKAELAELYTYSEMDEFALNFECFGHYMRKRKKEPIWHDLNLREKNKILQNLVESLESAEPEKRLEAVRIILYILQGAFGDFADLDAKDTDQWSTEATRNGSSNNDDNNDEGSGLDVADKWFGRDQGTGGFEPDCLIRSALNAYLVYDQGLYQRHADHSRQSSVSNSRSASHMDLAASSDGGGSGVTGNAGGTLERRRSKRSTTLADNERIRVVINCLYHMVEAIRREEHLEKIEAIASEVYHHNANKFTLNHLHSLRSQFLIELEEPLEQNRAPLLIHLLEMMPSFVRAKTPHYPIKKILLLSWKVLLATLGGIDKLKEEKARRRKEAGLTLVEDTLQVAMQMKPVLNCLGAPMGSGLLSLSSLGVDNNGSTQGNVIKGQLGQKVRSIHHPVRPFNRQIACSSSGRDSITMQEDYNRERNNAISEDECPNGIEETDGERKEEFAEEVDEAIVGGEEETEESEPILDEEGSALLDQVLEEMSASSSEEKQQDESSEKSRGEEEGRKEEGTTVSDGEATPQPQHFGETNAFCKATTAVIQLPPKITVSSGTIEQQYQHTSWNEDSNTNNKETVQKLVLDEEEKRDDSIKREMMELLNETRRKRLVMINIDRPPNSSKPNAQQNNYTDGGDQTPKACQSPTKVNSPWPPPPPPGLPWRPKVREMDIENFLQNERQKYFDFQLPGDSTTVYGLPDPVIHGSLATLCRNLYISLSEKQIKAEDPYNRYPFSQKEFVEDSMTERLYVRILPSMTEYVIALLKVILASLPSSKAKIDAVTILSDVLTPETDTNEVLSNSISLDLSNFIQTNVLEETVRVAIDINRHKELIIKAASAIIILLLKHLRLNHIYQFENFAQYLVLANCLPLILKFLDQNICRYFQSKHELSPFNYPQCALYFVRNGSEWPQLTAENVDGCGGCSELPSYYLWRNVFSSINLLRVINKLTKNKQARTMMLVVYKSAPVLKRCMRAKLGIFQLYVLKLLKMQARYLGRQWRKTNMELISAIYLRVRHRLNDDWAYANEITRTKSFDFQREENDLGMAIKRFNARRYPRIVKESEQQQQHGSGLDGEEDEHHQAQERLVASELAKTGIVDDWDPKEWQPLDNSLQSALAWEPEFSERFKQNYGRWLEEEVFETQTDWDSLLRNSRGLLDLYC